MSETVTGVVKAISEKDVNTARGPAKTYSLRIDDAWFSHGFKKPSVDRGDNVTLIHKGDSYKSVLSIQKNDSVATKAFNKGSFPIAPTDGQRSIIRQNALTNARELVCNIAPTDDLEAAAHLIIDTARVFESYTTGDIDRAEAEALLAKAREELCYGPKLDQFFINPESSGGPPFLGVHMAKSLRKSINDKCKECIHDPKSGLGSWRQQTHGCTSKDCPLYDVRPLSKGGKHEGSN